MSTDSQPSRRRPRWGRRLLVVFVLALVAVATLVFFAPRIATPIARGAIADAMPAGSTTEIGQLRLGWTGAQQIEGLVVTDADGDQIVNLSASLDRGLWSLARNQNDLGTLTLEGDLLIKPEGAGSGVGNKPAGDAGTKQEGSGSGIGNLDLSAIAAALDLTRLGITLIDPEGGPDIVASVSGTGALGPAGTGLDLHADVERAGERGSADIDITNVAWAQTAGGVELEGAEVRVDASGVPVALIDGVAGLDGVLRAVLGDTVTAQIDATASAQTYDASVSIEASDATLNGTVRYADGVVTAQGPIAAELNTAGVLALPQAAGALSDAGVDITGAPRATVTITELRAPVPAGGFDLSTYDAQGVAARAEIALGAASATVPAQLLGTQGAARTLATSPAAFTIDLTDPRAGAAVAGDVRATIDGRPAGSIGVDMRASDLLTDAGAVRTDALPALEGAITLTDVPTALAQAFVADSGLDLPADIGPTMTVRVDASAPTPGGPTRATIAASSQKLTASAALVAEGSVITASEPVDITLTDPSSTIARFLGDAGVSLAETGDAQVRIKTLSVDTAALAGETPDLSGVIADVTARIGPIRGTAITGEGAPIEFKVPRTAYKLALANGAADLSTTWANLHAGPGRVTEQVDVNVRATSLTSTPAIAGTITAEGVNAGAVGRALGDEELARSLGALGPSLRVTLEPEIADDRTAVALTATGQDADVSANATVTDAGVNANAVIGRLSGAVVDAFTGRPGLAQAALGGPVSARVDLSAGRSADGAIGVPIDARIELNSARTRTASPVSVRITESLARIDGPATIETTLTPEMLAALTAGPSGNQGDTSIALVDTTPARLTVNAFSAPLSPNAQTDLSIDAALDTGPIALRAPDGSTQRFDALRATAATTGTPGQAQVKARLDETGSGRKVISVNLTTDDLVSAGAVDLAGAAVTGNLQLKDAPAGLVDAFAGTGGTAAELLGPTATARIDLSSFPREGGTTSVTAESPNARVSYKGVVRNGAVVSTEPAGVTLTRIDRAFGFKLASVLPVVGGVTKTADDQPASITIPTVSIPLDLDPTKIAFDLKADIGTAAVQLDRGLAGLIDRRIVSPGGVRVGDSFEAFDVSMAGGVLRVTNFVLPIGEFELPADATYDFNSKTEDVIVRLPAGSLVADSIGGDLGPLRDIIGTALNPPLRKRGTLGADNAWKIDPSWQPPEEERVDPGEQIIRGLGGLLQRELNRDRDRDE